MIATSFTARIVSRETDNYLSCFSWCSLFIYIIKVTLFIYIIKVTPLNILVKMLQSELQPSKNTPLVTGKWYWKTTL